MKKLFLFLLLISLAIGSYAGHGNQVFMKRPLATWSNYPAGIRDVRMEVTPLGIYAQIDLIFTIGPSSAALPLDSQEAVIFFDLPAGSYVHDSWLWLDSVTIISAELMERRKASEIYANIVKRRRDPSLLMNVLPQEYQLNIYPVTSSYWRKVKITYSTPLLWQNGRANVTLPHDLLAASQTPPAFTLKVNTGALFFNPSFVEQPFTAWQTSHSGNSYELNVPATGYTGVKDLTLSFAHTLQASSRLSISPTGPNEGYYELLLAPTEVPNTSRYFNFVIDHHSSYEIYSKAELRRMIHQLLSTELRPQDYFNIFYRNSSGSVEALYTTWQPADSASVNNIGPAFSGSNSNTPASFSALLLAAMQFTAASPANAETIILNGNYLSLNVTNAKDIMNSLRASPLIFSHKARIIDYHYSATPGQSNSPAFASIFHSLLKDIADSCDGSYSFSGNLYYDDYTQRRFYNINLRDALRHSLSAGLPRTAAFQLNLPISGFTYNEFRTGSGYQYSPYEVYSESGRYYGSFNAPDSIRVIYNTPPGLAMAASPIASISAGDATFRKTWNYHNNKQLTGFGNTYKQAIIDSSIHNRVMSDFTAFLALETGDTIKASVGQSGAGFFPIKVPGSHSENTLIAYPNPFREQLTIESPDKIEEVRVYNAAGSLILQQHLTGGDKSWIWNGRDANGTNIPPGIYLIRVSGNMRSTAIRVNKLD